MSVRLVAAERGSGRVRGCTGEVDKLRVEERVRPEARLAEAHHCDETVSCACPPSPAPFIESCRRSPSAAISACLCRWLLLLLLLHADGH